MPESDVDSETVEIATEDKMVKLGQSVACTITKPCIMTISGDLGTGKSVFARSVIHALGHKGAVKSPTYTLVETYTTNGWRIAHLDLYRLNDPEELHYLAIDDIVTNCDLIIIEWPEKAEGLLPKASMAVTIEYLKHGRLITIVS